MRKLTDILVFFGMIATGKSTLAQLAADHYGLRYFNSDVLRKKLAGEEAASGRTAAMDEGIYSAEFTRKTYDALLEAARNEIRNRRGVVLDASYQSRSERGRVRELAEKAGVGVYFIYCFCPESVMKDRMEQRSGDPHAVSDGRWEIYLKQRDRFEPPDEIRREELIMIDTSAPPADLLLDLQEKIERSVR